ncbi:MAG: hypothetical protein AUI11_00790 [Acidobacteria bacterium 13_2_20CM_2_66_4]|nr:MAG: hypothetical protein AUI11_00790 [Acidobacteria bacterium 13_2_20CM_2_66_4]
MLNDTRLASPSTTPPLEIAADVCGQPLALRTLDSFQHLRSAADLGPPRDERADDARAARVVRILIGVDFDAALARLPDALDERHRQSPARRPERLHMRDDARQVSFFRDANHFVDGGDDADVEVRLVADVAFVHAAHIADDFRERDDFIDLCVVTWRVIEARRQTDSAGFHPVLRERDHLRELVRARRAIGHAEHLAPNRSMRHVQRDVDADAALLVADPLRPQVHRSAAVRVERDGRDALRDQLPRILQRVRQTVRRVRMDVDEARRDRQPARIDDARRRRVAEPSHVDNPRAADSDVGGQPRIAAAVEHAAALDQHVIRLGCLSGQGSRDREARNRTRAKSMVHARYVTRRRRQP